MGLRFVTACAGGVTCASPRTAAKRTLIASLSWLAMRLKSAGPLVSPSAASPPIAFARRGGRWGVAAPRAPADRLRAAGGQLVLVRRDPFQHRYGARAERLPLIGGDR